jgi:hypothetical protein
LNFTSVGKELNPAISLLRIMKGRGIVRGWDALEVVRNEEKQLGDGNESYKN